MTRIHLALILCTTATLSHADAPLGQMRAFLDGDELRWHTITMTQNGRSVATASFEQYPSYADLYMQGHLEPRFVSKGMLSVDARFTGQFIPGDSPASLEIIYMPNGMGGQFFTSRGTEPGPQLDIVDFTVWGGFGEVVAAFSGTLCAAWMNRPIDRTDCKDVSGQVTTRVVIE